MEDPGTPVQRWLRRATKVEKALRVDQVADGCSLCFESMSNVAHEVEHLLIHRTSRSFRPWATELLVCESEASSW